MDDNHHHDEDSDALASALGAIGAHQDDGSAQHHFHHQLQPPDFSHGHKSQDDLDVNGSVDVDVDSQGLGEHEGIDVHALDIPVEGEDDLDLNLGSIGTPGLDVDDSDGGGHRGGYGRPPSIRKACDLCHAAKQKCSGERPSCSRCIAGGWTCNYAPRQRRRTVPKNQKMSSTPIDHHQMQLQQQLQLQQQAQQAAQQQLQQQQQQEEQRRQQMQQDQQRAHQHNLFASAVVSSAQQRAGLGPGQVKKRKLGHRDIHSGNSNSFGGEMDMKVAMGMAVDLGLAGEDEGDELISMSDDQMLESLAIDGYLADLPLATFVHNLPYQAGHSNQPPPDSYQNEDFGGGNDNTFPSTDMDQHTTSALRDAIFSLNESSGGGTGHGDGGEGDQGGEGQGENGEGLDPHLALLDLSHAMPVDGEGDAGDQQGDSDHLNLGQYTNHQNHQQLHACTHIPLVPHILGLLTQHGLEPKPGSNTPLTLGVFAPLARSLRLFLALVNCPICSSSPQQTLPQLALLSRTTTILTFPFPPINTVPGTTSPLPSSASIMMHGARLSGTGISPAIEQHIVGVVWDSWRAAVREIFAQLERRAQEIITTSAQAMAAAASAEAMKNSEKESDKGKDGDGDPNDPSKRGRKSASAQPAPEQPKSTSSAETQRAGLMFQAMSRLVTAMDEVEGN